MSWSSLSACSSLNVLYVEHQARKLFLDEANFPGVLVLLEVFQVVIPIHIDEVELHVLRVVALSLEEFVKRNVWVLLEVAPDHQDLLATRIGAVDDAEAANGIDVLHAQTK